MALCDSDVNELIRVAYNFVLAKYNENHKVEQRNSIARALHDQFPQLDENLIRKKLRQRASNVRRPPKKKVRKNTETITSNGTGKVSPENSTGDDYDFMLKSYNISVANVDDDGIEYLNSDCDENEELNDAEMENIVFEEYDVA